MRVVVVALPAAERASSGSPRPRRPAPSACSASVSGTQVEERRRARPRPQRAHRLELDDLGRPRPRGRLAARRPLGAARRPRPDDRRDRRARQGRRRPALLRRRPAPRRDVRRRAPRSPSISRSASRATSCSGSSRRRRSSGARLARELHDETGQTLTSILLGLKSVEERRRPSDARQSPASRRVRSATLQDVRRIALELRPKVLDDYGLVSALERLARPSPTQTGIAGRPRGPARRRAPADRGRDGALPDRPGGAHERRQARRAEPRERARDAEERERPARARGRRPAASTRPATTAAGLGLEGMRERVELLEGRLTIESTRGAGTTLVVEVPVR